MSKVMVVAGAGAGFGRDTPTHKQRRVGRELMLKQRAPRTGRLRYWTAMLIAACALVSAPTAAMAPDAPSNFTAFAVSPTQISLSWTGALGSASFRYRVDRKTGAGGSYTTVTNLEDTTSWFDTGLAAGTEYFYRVRVSTLGLVSAWSSEVSATTLSAGVALPTSDVRLWLKGDSGIVKQTTNKTVAAWLDVSGWRNHGFQSTTANQASSVSNAVNGLPVVRFDGTNFVNVTEELSLRWVDSISAAPDGSIWFGSGKKLWHYHPDAEKTVGKKFESFTRRDGLASDSIRSTTLVSSAPAASPLTSDSRTAAVPARSASTTADRPNCDSSASIEGR